MLHSLIKKVNNEEMRFLQYKKILLIFVIALAIPLTVYFAIQGIKYFTKATSQPGTLTFSQNPLILNASTPTVVNLVLNTNTTPVGFAKVKFTFDQTKIKLTNEIVPTTSLQTVISQTTMSEANSTGQVTLILGLDPAHVGSPPSGSFNLAQLTFIALSNIQSSSDLSFVTTDLQVVDMSTFPFALTTTNAAVNITSTTANQATLNFKIKFQGITTNGNNKTVAIKISTTNNVNLSPDTSGIYSGTVTDIPIGTYDISIKEQNYLTKKFPGITLVAGDNNQDFTGSPLKAGDFNNDNKLNILDIGLILSQYTALSAPVTTQNKIYDVNGDGIINISDIALVLANYTQLELLGE